MSTSTDHESTEYRCGAIDSVEGNHIIITSLLHGGNPVSTSTASTAPYRSGNFQGLRDDILHRVQNNASILWNSGAIAVMVQRLQNFLLVCLCNVLQFEEFPEDDIDQIMRTIIPGEKSYLSKVRKGDRRTNALIDKLSSRGWGNRGSELLVLWNKPPTYYADFGDRWHMSREKFLGVLSKDKFTSLPQVKDGWMPMFYPAMVHKLLGKTVSIARISECLGYQNSHVLEVQHPWVYFQGYSNDTGC